MARRANALLRESFEKWDEDGSGTISKEELATVLQHLGNFKPADIDKIMVQADHDGNGEIDYGEFVDWLLRPATRLGAAALLSTSVLCLRAESTTLGSPVKTAGEARWTFGANASGPVRLDSALPLPREHTIILWVQFQAVGGQWAQLVGDTREGWGLSIGIGPSGRLGINDPRSGEEKCVEEPSSVEHGCWGMVVARGICETAGPSPHGCTEFLVASSEACVRFLGSVEAVGSGLVVQEFGCKCAGVSAIASVAIWSKLLADEELRDLFLWDAVRFGCVTEEQAAWLRLNRRRAPARSEEEEENLTRRLAAAASGKADGLLDLSELKVADDDLPRVIDGVEAAYDGVTALGLSKNYITEDGVKAHLVPFLQRLNSAFRLDLRGNEDINSDAEGPLLEALTSLPASWGISVDARGTRLGGEVILKLLNQGPEAAEAALAADKERKRTAAKCAEFDAKQADLIARWTEEVDPPTSLEPPDAEGDTAEAPFDKFPVGDAVKLREVRAILASRARYFYDSKGGPKNAWSVATGKRPVPRQCGTGQFIAHFSYLSYAMLPRDHTDFGLRLRQRGEPLAAPHGVVGLHAAVENGEVQIDSASGRSYGRDALTLRLENLSGKSLRVAVPAGTIFQHISWIHRQNLLVGRTVHFRLGPGEAKEQKLGAFCMNASCACSAGDPMTLTALLFEDAEILQSQGKVWEHFEGLFRKYREEAGFPDDMKKKGKKKGRKKR